MFKLTYQAYILFCICTNYIVFKLVLSKNRYTAYLGFILLVVNISTFCYGIDAIITSYKDSKHLGTSATESYIESTIPDDYEAIKWIRQNIEKDKVILEASSLGNSYSTCSRISTFTSNPTVLGWSYHQWIWRANKDYSMPDEVTNRNRDIKSFYNATNITDAKNFIEHYNIDYIYIGNLEYETYSNIDLNLLSSLGTVVYSTNSVSIIKVDK